jgi:hypothetical protein
LYHSHGNKIVYKKIKGEYVRMKNMLFVICAFLCIGTVNAEILKYPVDTRLLEKDSLNNNVDQIKRVVLLQNLMKAKFYDGYIKNNVIHIDSDNIPKNSTTENVNLSGITFATLPTKIPKDLLYIKIRDMYLYPLDITRDEDLVRKYTTFYNSHDQDLAKKSDVLAEAVEDHKKLLNSKVTQKIIYENPFDIDIKEDIKIKVMGLFSQNNKYIDEKNIDKNKPYMYIYNKEFKIKQGIYFPAKTLRKKDDLILELDTGSRFVLKNINNFHDIKTVLTQNIKIKFKN